MKIDFGVNVIIYFAAIATGLFSGVLLLVSGKNKLANRLLGMLMLTITCWIIDAFFRASNLYGQYASLYFLPIFYSFSFGPLIYFYVQAITNKCFKIKKVHLLHFLPVLIQALFYWVVTFQSYETKYYIWFHVHQPYTYRIEYDGTWLSLVIYIVLSIRYMNNYQLWLSNNYSNLSKGTLNWLKASLMVLMLVCIAWLFEAYLRDFSGIYYKYDKSATLLCIVIYCIGILGYQQSNIEIAFVAEKDNSKTIVADAQVIKRIEDAVTGSRLYLNPELTLADLAKHLNLQPKTVSANINAGFGKPFNSYINTYRVDEVKRRLQGTDVERLTLLGIAYESGFNSKTSFNRIFKDVTGKSPSDFVKK